MYCTKCGKEIKEGQKFCTWCGNNLIQLVPDDKKENRKKKSNKRKIIAILFSLSAVLFAILFLMNNTKMKEGIFTREDYDCYITYDNRFLNIEKEYYDDEGFVPAAEVSKLLDAVEIEVKAGLQANEIVSYERNDDNIYVKFSSGVSYFFIPYQKNMLGVGPVGNICTLEPTADDDSVNIQYFVADVDKMYNDFEYQGSYHPEACAQMITQAFPRRYTYNNMSWLDTMPFFPGGLVNSDARKNDGVTIEDLKNLDGYKIIIFEGHGGYTSELHSVLITGEVMVGFKDWNKYSKDIEEERIAVTSFCWENGIFRYYAVTNKFFDTYLKGLDDTIVFLGGCHTGQDDVLANSLLNKGASVVLGYSDTVSMEYEMLTRANFFYALTSQLKGRNATIQEAINYAKNIVGATDSISERNTELCVFSKNGEENRLTLNGMRPEEVTESETIVTTESELITESNMDSSSGDIEIFKLMPKEFVFTSGAGAWATIISLSD